MSSSTHHPRQQAHFEFVMADITEILPVKYNRFHTSFIILHSLLRILFLWILFFSILSYSYHILKSKLFLFVFIISY